MATVEERLAYIEGRVQEHTRGMEDFRSAVARLDQRFDALGGRVDALDLKIDRFREEFAGQLHAMASRLDGRMDALDLKIDRVRDELASRLDRVDQKLSRVFLWVVGVQMTVLLAVIGSLLQLAR